VYPKYRPYMKMVVFVFVSEPKLYNQSDLSELRGIGNCESLITDFKHI